MTLEVLTPENAPQAARPLLEKAREKYGFVPNILGVMANSPALLEAYITLSGIFEKTAFSPAEKQLVLLGASIENGCDYCTAAHSAIARMQGVDGSLIEAAVEGQPLPDQRLDALYRFTRTMVRTRGRPSDEDLKTFLDAGYRESQVQDVIVGIALKTLSNYNNHLAGTPIDDAFRAS
ncbi:MAG: carboxymuconolactone decarboxylase family protein [Wenzhouxiangellaceae bacterium]